MLSLALQTQQTIRANKPQSVRLSIETEAHLKHAAQLRGTPKLDKFNHSLKLGCQVSQTLKIQAEGNGCPINH